MADNKQQTAVDFIFDELASKNLLGIFTYEQFKQVEEILNQAKEMDKEKHEKFNKFLNDEKQLKISDLKTIERIQWYYNTYFNETYGGNK
jgi:hypothetical protein